MLNWLEILTSSFQASGAAVISFVPNIIGAIIVFAIGWIIAIGLAKLVKQLVDMFKVDQLLEKLGAKEILEKAGLRWDSGAFVGALIKWFFIIVFLLAVTEILQLFQVSEFLRDVLLYVPNIIIAVVIMLAAVLLANVLHRVVKATVSAAGLASADFLATLTRWAIFVFAFLAALIQLGIAPALINTLITGLIAMLAIAGGLAFGLGGKDYASQLIEKVRRDMGSRS